MNEFDLSNLTDENAAVLLALTKLLLEDKSILFPKFGEKLTLLAQDMNRKFNFSIDINRKAAMFPSKCAYQLRIQNSLLLRLDVDPRRVHTNPGDTGGETFKGSHIHVWDTTHNMRHAYPVPENFTDLKDLVLTLSEFMDYCNIKRADNLSLEIQEQME